MSVARESIDRLSPTRCPIERPIGYQRWHDLLFLHWRISPAEIAAHLPDTLSVDTFDGSAWIGLVPFRMTAVRPWWSPSVPGISSFPETNVRTYVHFRGTGPGVWFLSLDAASSLGVRLGRAKWKLPYHRSIMKVRRLGATVRYTCERLWPGEFGVGGTIEAEIGDTFGGLDRNFDLGRAVPGSLEHFLVERYLLYARKEHRLFRGQVHHTPYPLREARVLYEQTTFLRAIGFHIERPPDHVLFSEGIAVDIFPLREVPL